MRPYKKKIKKQERASIQESTSYETNVMNGIKWRQILSEGKTVELIDG